MRQSTGSHEYWVFHDRAMTRLEQPDKLAECIGRAAD
jgi:hypothetical protein